MIQQLSFKPHIGVYCIAYGPGPWLWLETTSGMAREARREMGEIMAGINQPFKGATPEEGWAYARREGYRVVRVDIFPHASGPERTEI